MLSHPAARAAELDAKGKSIARPFLTLGSQWRVSVNVRITEKPVAGSMSVHSNGSFRNGGTPANEMFTPPELLPGIARPNEGCDTVDGARMAQLLVHGTVGALSQ